MTPVSIIREKFVMEPEVIDLEAVGARLEHHGLRLSIGNVFLSDTGDRWRCQVWDINDHDGEGPMVESIEPSLRTAMIRALKKAEELLLGRKG